MGVSVDRPSPVAPLHVAIVSPYDLGVPGGVQQHVAHLAAALRAGGDRVTVVGPGEDGEAGARTVGGSMRVAFNDSVAPIALRPDAWTRTRRVLREVQPDVVHVHEPFVPWVGLAATLTADVPVVATFHAWSDRARMYGAAGRLLGPVLRRVAVRIAVSPAAASYHAHALRQRADSFRLIPNGVDVARFRDPLPMPVDDDGPLLLFVGRLEPRKGLEHLLHAFAILKATSPDVRLHVIGDGPDRTRCEALLPDRLRRDVTFLGRVDNGDLPRWYRAADVFVAPALGGESFGIVLIEAQAAGCPVVASDIPGYRSVITDGVNGRLVPPRDPRALADALGALLDNAAARQALVRAGDDGVDRYDWATIAAEVREVYAEVVGPDRAAL